MTSQRGLKRLVSPSVSTDSSDTTTWFETTHASTRMDFNDRFWHRKQQQHSLKQLVSRQSVQTACFHTTALSDITTRLETVNSCQRLPVHDRAGSNSINGDREELGVGGRWVGDATGQASCVLGSLQCYTQSCHYPTVLSSHIPSW